MAEEKDLLHQLKISCSILGTTINKLAQEWGVSRKWVCDVASGEGTSQNIRERIKGVIEEAQQTIPFEYPDET